MLTIRRDSRDRGPVRVSEIVRALIPSNVCVRHIGDNPVASEEWQCRKKAVSEALLDAQKMAIHCNKRKVNIRLPSLHRLRGVVRFQVFIG